MPQQLPEGAAVALRADMRGGAGETARFRMVVQQFLQIDAARNKLFACRAPYSFQITRSPPRALLALAPGDAFEMRERGGEELCLYLNRNPAVSTLTTYGVSLCVPNSQEIVLRVGFCTTTGILSEGCDKFKKI